MAADRRTVRRLLERAAHRGTGERPGAAGIVRARALARAPAGRGHGPGQVESVRALEGARRQPPVYGLLEWARTSEAGGFFVFRSLLAEGAWTGGRHRLYYRFERTERPEEERISDFRSLRPHLENSILGITRWTVHTAGYALQGLGSARSGWSRSPSCRWAASTCCRGRSRSSRSTATIAGGAGRWASDRAGAPMHRMGRYGAAARTWRWITDITAWDHDRTSPSAAVARVGGSLRRGRLRRQRRRRRPDAASARRFSLATVGGGATFPTASPPTSGSTATTPTPAPGAAEPGTATSGIWSTSGRSMRAAHPSGSARSLCQASTP